jgi:outer membrane autotransporter protein
MEHRRPPSSGDDERGWEPFAGVDMGMFWTDSGAQNQYRTMTFMTGVSRQYYNPAKDSFFLLAGFIDGGIADYDVEADYGFLAGPHITGDGKLRYLGVGLMTRYRWSNGFRLEGSARTGRIRNTFDSEFTSADQMRLHYELETPYYALHFGLGREWFTSNNSSLDLVARYFWTRQDGDDYLLSDGDTVTFDKNISHRGRVGARYNKFKNERLSLYLGASYEHEFDSKTRGYLWGQPFETPNHSGGTGIGEIGVIFKSTPEHRFNVEAGIQGHFGVRRGVSGGLRLGYEF